MKIANKSLSIILSVCMVLALLPATALADTPDPNFLVIHAGSAAVPYATLAEAVAIAVDGDTIQAQMDVNQDLEPNATITINKNLTLDLGSHTVSLLAPNCTVLSVSNGSSLLVENGTLIVGTSGTDPAISVAGGSLTIAEEAPAVINIEARQNGLSVTGGGDATVTSVRISEEGGAAVLAEGVSASDADDFSQATVLEDVNVAVEDTATPSSEGTYGAVAKAGAAIEVGGDVVINIAGVSGETDCAAVWATGTDSQIEVVGSVSATSKYGGAYGAAADKGGYVDVQGDASATGVGTTVNTSTGECEDMVAAAATRDSGSYVYVYDATATGEKNAFGCVSSGGYVSLSGNAAVSATGASAFACGAASYGSGGSTYTAGDTTVSASGNGSTAIGGHALAGGGIELWNLRVSSPLGSAFGIVAEGVSPQNFPSNVVAQAKVTYSGDASSAGAWAKSGGWARVNGYFTEEVATPVIQVNNNTTPTYTTPDAYDTYTDATDGSTVFIIGLGKISGTVKDANGAPLPGVTVWVYEEHFSAVTDVNGQYSIDPMPLYQPECWATVKISENVSRVIYPFIRSMEKGSTTTVDFTNTSTLFAMTEDRSLLNDMATFGLIGTRAASSNAAVVDTYASDSRVRITSQGEGSATVTVTDASSHKATIAVTVDAHGYLTIGTIKKYTASSSNDNGSPSGGGTITTAPKATVSGSVSTANVTGTISGGTQTISVPGDTMTSLMDAVKKLEIAGNSATTVINAGSGSGLTVVKATIPGTQFDAFASGTNASLQLTSGLASLVFSPAAVDKISNAGSGDVSLTMGMVGLSTLSAAQRQTVGDRPVYSFSVNVGGTAVTQLGGDVMISIPYTLGSNEDPNAIVVYYLDASGTLQTMQGKYDAATKSVAFTTSHFSDYVIGYNKVSFRDVTSSAWYADAVTFLAARGITSGTTATTFSPDATLTRGQFITLLLQAYGIKADASAVDNFSDAGKTYYTGYLAAAKKLSITTGAGNNMFAPEQAITRQEMFTMLYNALKVFDKLPEGASGKTLSDFTDSGSIAYWAQDAMTSLIKSGTVTGDDGKINPTDTTTRAQMAQVLYNLLGK